MDGGSDGPMEVTRAGCSTSRDVLHLTLAQVGLILLVSNLLHVVLKRFKQPSAVSQILAGVLLGPTVLGNIDGYALTFLRGTNRLTSLATSGRMVFMFVVGLEIDAPYICQRLRRATVVSFGGWAVSAAGAALISNLIRYLLDLDDDDTPDDSSKAVRQVMFGVVLALLFANTASPIMIRIVTELKLAMSEVGRMALSAALVSDATAMLFLTVLSLLPTVELRMDGESQQMAPLIFGALFILAWVAMLRFLVKRLNRCNHRRRHIKNWHVMFVITFVLSGALVGQVAGYSSMVTSFLFGLAIPRDGCTARTLLEWMTFPVHEIILPIYFGYNTMLADFKDLFREKNLFFAAVLVVSMSTAGKVAGTVLATTILKMPLQEGMVLGFLLNVKGHLDLVLLSLGVKSRLWAVSHHSAMVIILATNTICAGPIASIAVYVQRKAFQYRSISLQRQHRESELRMLSCVHGPRDLPAMLNLVEILTGPGRTLLAPYVMHLVELTKHTIAATRIHHQCRDGDDWEFGGENDRQITVMCSAFQQETNITVRQLTGVSSYHDMHDDVCNGVQDTRASLVIMPFHKRQRIDGRMGVGKDGVHNMNKKVLLHAPCTVGVLIDRGLGGATPQAAQDALYTIGVLFFGGPDDREAAALGARLAQHPMVGLTLVRFRPRSWKEYDEGVKFAVSRGDDVSMSVSNLDMEREEDESFLSDFHDRFVSKGLASMVEKYVHNGPETVTALSEMEGMYMLYLVGRGKQGLSQLTVGLGDWEEFPELGSIGDLLASSDFMSNSSVLVLWRDMQIKNSSEEEDFPLL